MQQIFKRAAVARNHAKRKTKKVTAVDRRDQMKSNLREKIALRRNELDEAIEERKARREDWLRGPLAPRRDIGTRHGIYGTVTSARLRLPKLEPSKRMKHIPFAVGDRVCVLQGRDKGKIGRIMNVEAESESVVVDGVNIYDVEFPSFALAGDNDKRPYRPYPLPLSFKDVRLVVPLEDPATGIVKDAIVDHVYSGAPFLDRPTGVNLPRHTRYIAGMDIEIPWPEAEEPKFTDQPIDTLRIQVEDKSYIPSLQTFPMPSSVIDELRNKYSKYRIRHDPEYIQQKEKEAVQKEWQNNRKLITPKTEFLAKKVEEKAKLREAEKDEEGNFKLDKNTASFIEQFMASRRQQQPNAS